MNQLNTIIWGEVLATGGFTLLGSAVGAATGAFFGGKFAVDAVKKELKYNEYKSHIKEIEDSLRIITPFLHGMMISVSTAQDNKKIFEEYKTNKKPFKNTLVDSLKEVSEYTNQDLIDLKKIQLNQADIVDYKNYLVIIDRLTVLKMLSEKLSREILETNMRQEIYESEHYLEIVEHTDKLIEYQRELERKEDELSEEKLRISTNLKSLID